MSSHFHDKGGYDDSHHLILKKIPPQSITELARELQLPGNVDICARAQKGKTFEECLGIIASELDIALDGYYDAADLGNVLLTALRKRGAVGNQPWKAHEGLVSVELVEREGTVTLEEGSDVGTVVQSNFDTPKN